MISFAYERLAADAPLPGVILTTNEQSIGAAIEHILMIVECMTEDEIRGQVIFLPL